LPCSQNPICVHLCSSVAIQLRIHALGVTITEADYPEGDEGGSRGSELHLEVAGPDLSQPPVYPDPEVAGPGRDRATGPSMSGLRAGWRSV
jgi:hypothetical protein